MTDWSSVLNHAFATVRKNAGDTGDTGDTRHKALRLRDISRSRAVTGIKTRPVTPVTTIVPVTGVTGRENQGGDTRPAENSIELQTLASAVTGVTAVTGEIQAPPHRVLQQLRRMSARDDFGAERWRQLLDDAERFFARWTEQVGLQGWTDNDLVGVHPVAPSARYDAMGLLLLTRGGEVIGLQKDRASIRSPGGSVLVYLKRASDAVPIFSLR
jgi:hypothetical protein